jgi:peptidoglycan/LPS O-acetylase OafA/YrhL
MKPHYPILDGLRGTAAIMVIIFHLFEARYPNPIDQPIHHGYLAVDFFYLLSGFVVGYAYDDRWAKMSVIGFLKIRLVRLHPLVILSVIIGALCFWFDPFTNGATWVNPIKFIATVLIGFTLLPTPDIRGAGETHSLDGPCWSLLQEYIANIIYALFGRVITIRILWAIVIISAAALLITTIWNGDIAAGWDYKRFWIAEVRMMFPFFAGLLLFRTGKIIKIQMAYVLCSLALIIVFMLPTHQFTALYEAGCIIIVFPLIVAAGAGGQIKGLLAQVCKFSGTISYPLYIIHYPLIYIYTAWIGIKKPDVTQIISIGIMLFTFCILLAWIILKLYDEPVRKWLKQKYLSH